MIRRARLALIALMLGAPRVAQADVPSRCPSVVFRAIPVPAAASAMVLRQAIRIVAFGSSSTAGAGASGPQQAYPARLEAALRQALPDTYVVVLNRGIGGEDISSMVARIDTAVIPERPDLVIWQTGANAALRGMPRETFRQNLLEGLRRLRRAGIEVVLMDNQRAPRITSREGHRAYDDILAEVAAAVPGVTLFSRGRMMDAWADAGVPNSELLAPDGLHHNDRGYHCVAEALGAAIAAGLASQR